MPCGLTKFQDSWLSKELDGVPVKEWCRRMEADNFSARCVLCSEKFDISNSGFSQVKSHHKGKKHRQKFDARFSSKPIAEAFRASTVAAHDASALPFDMRVVKAEALWALNITQNNGSFKSCNEIVDLFKEMFPDSQIAAGMELREKKVSYIISHGLATHFKEELKRDLIQSPSQITVAFDETTNSQVKHQLDIYVRYWSAEINGVSCRYVTSIFMGHATANLLLKELLDAFSTADIPLSRIICLSMDGPNVNKALLRKFNEVLQKETGKETLDIGFCNLHVVNNAFKQLMKLQIDFDELATDIHHFLKNSAARREDYKAVEEITTVTARFLMNHVSSRWLTVGPVAERLLEQWPNLIEYFLKFLPQQKTLQKQLANSERYKRIHSALKNPTTPGYLSFLSFTHKHFERFSLCFQSDAPKIHLLYSETNSLIRNVMGQFISDGILADKCGQDLQIIDLENGSMWKPLKELEIGVKTKNLISKLEEKVRKCFLLDVRSALIATTKYLKGHLPFCNQKLKDLEIFCPRISWEVSDQSNITEGIHTITRICSYVQFSEELTDKVREEWKLLRCDKSAQEELHKVLSSNTVCAVQVDHYWRAIFDITDQFGRKKYTHLAKLIKSSLILPHGNADPERGFSVNNAMLSKERSSFSDMTIKSLRIVKGAILHYGGVRQVPITSALLHSVKNSHKVYKEYLEKQKAEERKLQKEKEEREKESREVEDQRKRKADVEEKIKENDEEIKRIRKERQAALAIIQEGNARMKKAVSTLNATEINVAQGLIVQGTEELSKLDAQLSALETEKEKHVKKRLKL